MSIVVVMPNILLSKFHQFLCKHWTSIFLYQQLRSRMEQTTLILHYYHMGLNSQRVFKGVYLLPNVFQGLYIMCEDFYSGPETVYLEVKCWFKLNTLREFGPACSIPDLRVSLLISPRGIYPFHSVYGSSFQITFFFTSVGNFLSFLQSSPLSKLFHL
jgi:hypothetical protein